MNSEWNTQPQDSKNLTFFRTVRPIAENIIGMVILPRAAETATSTAASTLELAPKYLYDTRNWQTRSKSAKESIKSQHQLPPILDISFISVEENSFATFALRTGILEAKDDPKLIDKELFTDVKKFTKDFDEVEKKLRKLKIEYRIFNSTIRLRESKWTDS